MTDFTMPDAMPADDGAATPAADRPAALLAALERQLDLFRQLQALSSKQGGLIGAEDGSPLLELIARRQTIIEQLQDLQRDADARQLTAAPLSAAERREASELTELIAAVRARILEQDEHDRAALRDFRNRVGGELRRMTQGGQAAKAYGGPRVSTSVSRPTISRFTDKQG
jgi:hypothetical protein